MIEAVMLRNEPDDKSHRDILIDPERAPALSPAVVR